MLPEASELMPDLDREIILREARPFNPLTYLEDFERRFPTAMQILHIGGVHPTEDVKMDNPYTKASDNEPFNNVGEHCLAVACFAQSIARPLQERGILTQTEADETIERGLEHDANKRIELFRKKAAKTGNLPTNDVYSPEGYATIATILLAQGYHQATVEYIVKAGRETGHTSFKDFLTLQDGIPSLVPGRMVDKIVHLADDMTSTSIPQEEGRPLTVYLTTWERMVASEFPSRYAHLWKEGLGFDPEGKIIELKDITAADRSIRWVRSYACWQPWIANEICRAIQGIVDPENKQKPEYFVKDLVNNFLIPAA